MDDKTKTWFYYAGIRAIKTICQTAVATIGTSAVMSEVNWTMVVSASILAGILSLLTSVAGIPEADFFELEDLDLYEEDDEDENIE